MITARQGEYKSWLEGMLIWICAKKRTLSDNKQNNKFVPLNERPNHDQIGNGWMWRSWKYKIKDY